LLPDDDDLHPTDMDWEQLLAATFDPADAMFLGPDEMFSLNRNDVLYAQKYAAARTSTVTQTTPPTGERGLNDDDLERCANDLDRFVNDLELACANITQRDAENCGGKEEQSTTNDVNNDLDLDLVSDANQSHEQSTENPVGRDLDANQGHFDDIDLDEGDDNLQPSNNTGDDLEGCERNSVGDHQTENCLQNSDENVDRREDSADEDNSQRRVLSDLEPGDLKVIDGPEIALCEMTNDLPTVHRYPYDPDPEATVV